MADRDLDEVVQRLTNALPEAIGEMVTGWTLIANTITDDGERASWWLTADGQLDEVTLGHVRRVDHAIMARMVAERLEQ